MLLVRCHDGSAVHKIEYELDNEFEIFQFQVSSLFDESVLILDFMGREIECRDDLDDVKFKMTTDVGDDLISCETDSQFSVDVWCMSKTVDGDEFCFDDMCRDLKPNRVQLRFQLVDTPFRLCTHCIKVFDRSLITETNTLDDFSCESRQAVGFGLALDHASNLLDSQLSAIKSCKSLLEGPVQAYLNRKMLKRSISRQIDQNNPEVQDFEKRIVSGIKTVQAYENWEFQESARTSIDFPKVREYYGHHLANPSPSDRSGPREDLAFLRALLQWFKCDFFRWCNKPECSNVQCGARPNEMDSVGVSEPSLQERSEGWAGRTEVYKCKRCNEFTRFPRYNNPAHLLRTRLGRCGEWANAFCLICRSVGLDARWVLDFTDHVWVEVWIPALKRFVHLDPCERALDAPLMYETGWNKKLTYVLAFSRYGVGDATPRYSRKQAEVLVRRNALPEKSVVNLIRKHDDAVSRHHAERHPATAPPPTLPPPPPPPAPVSPPAPAPPQALSPAVPLGSSCSEVSSSEDSLLTVAGVVATGRDAAAPAPAPAPLLTGPSLWGARVANVADVLEAGALAFQALAMGDVCARETASRRRCEGREMEAMTLWTKQECKLEELCGRQSGDVAWREARGELGDPNAPIAAAGSTGAGGGTGSIDRSSGGEIILSSGGLTLSPSSQFSFCYPIRSNQGVGGVGGNADHLLSVSPWVRPGLVCATSAARWGHIDVSVRSGGFGDPSALVVPTSITNNDAQMQPQGQPQGQDTLSVAAPDLQLIAVGGVCLSVGGRGLNSVAFDGRSGSLLSSSCSASMSAPSFHAWGDSASAPSSSSSSSSSSVTHAAPLVEAEGEAGGTSPNNFAPDSVSVIESIVVDAVLEGVAVIEEGAGCQGEGAEVPMATKHFVDSRIQIGRHREGGGESGDVQWHVTHSLPSGRGPSLLRMRLPLRSRKETTSTHTLSSISTCRPVRVDHAIDGSICSVPFGVLSMSGAGEGSELQELVEVASARCEADHSLLGFSLCCAGRHALLFGDAGYPLVPRTRRSVDSAIGCTTGYCTFVKTTHGGGSEGRVGDEGEGAEANSHDQYRDQTSSTSTPVSTGVDVSNGDGRDDGDVPNDISPSPSLTRPSTTLSSMAQTVADRLEHVVLKYVPLGGNRHGDTAAFDSSRFLWPLVDQAAEALARPQTHSRGGGETEDARSGMHEVTSHIWNDLRVDEVVVWAGRSLVNGVQCSLSFPYPRPPQGDAGDADVVPSRLRIPSPPFSSTHDSPTPQRLPLEHGDEIVSVTVYAGDLVDRIVLRSAYGRELSAGGSGGSPIKVDIPRGWKFVGFYGGTGGHLHNVGVVLLRSGDGGVPAPTGPLQSPSPSSSLRLFHRLIELALKHNLPACGMLNYQQFSVHHIRDSDIGTLIDLCKTTLLSNPTEVAKTCINTCALYIENMIKKPDDPKLRLVRIGNAFFGRTILCAAGGLALFCFGPAGFRLIEGMAAEGAACPCSFVSYGQSSTSSRDIWIQWLKSYAAFLREVVGVEV